MPVCWVVEGLDTSAAFNFFPFFLHWLGGNGQCIVHVGGDPEETSPAIAWWRHYVAWWYGATLTIKNARDYNQTANYKCFLEGFNSGKKVVCYGFGEGRLTCGCILGGPPPVPVLWVGRDGQCVVHVVIEPPKWHRLLCGMSSLHGVMLRCQAQDRRPKNARDHSKIVNYKPFLEGFLSGKIASLVVSFWEVRRLPYYVGW